MNKELNLDGYNSQELINGLQFNNWTALNDSIMGGLSKAECSLNADGLELYGNLVEEGGGFVSCRSPIFNPPLNFSKYQGLQIHVEGKGRTLKFALFCQASLFGLTDLIADGLHWVAEIPTSASGLTCLNIPFKDFQPTIRARSTLLPISLNTSCITRLQLLYSKFGTPGEINSSFETGPIRFLLRSINGFY